MDLLKWFRPAVRRVDASAVQPAGGGQIIATSKDLEEYLRRGGETASGAHVNADSAMRVAAVYGSVRLISGAVGNIPLGLKRRVDARTREDASDDPLYRVLCKPRRGRLTPSALRRMMTAHVLLRGNAYALKVMSMGRVVDLFPLDPDRMRVDQLDDMSLVYTYTRRDGGQVTLPAEDVFHLMGLTLDGIRGVSVLTYAREAVGVSLTTEMHGAKMFANGTTIGLVFKYPNSLSPEAVERLKASLAEYRGAANANRNLILEDGGAAERVAMTSEDAQYIETRKFTRGEIEMFFGVPGFMLGDTEKSTSWGTGLEQQTRGFVTFTLEDHLTAWEETIARDLLPPDSSIFARFNRAALVRGDLAARWEAYVKGLQWGVYSPNEVRAMEDENPREGGDRYYDPPNTAGTSGGGNVPAKTS
ncbi:phage portal protein [Xanthobacter flavus]|uniref:phage portal protein n=1 Tax=Xanthobacter flavus TaxID=281 RepID=UPI00372B150E